MEKETYTKAGVIKAIAMARETKMVDTGIGQFEENVHTDEQILQSLQKVCYLCGCTGELIVYTGLELDKTDTFCEDCLQSAFYERNY